MAERIDHKDFRSYEYGRGRNRKYTIRYFSRPERRYRRAAERYEDYSAGGSMLVKWAYACFYADWRWWQNSLQGGGSCADCRKPY